MKQKHTKYTPSLLAYAIHHLWPTILWHTLYYWTGSDNNIGQ